MLSPTAMFPYHEEIPYPTPQCIANANAIVDETVIGWIDDSNAFVRFFLERFLQDDGSICLGFLIVVFAIRQVARYLMDIWSRSLDSSPGYSCGDTATTYTNRTSSSSSTSRSRSFDSSPGYSCSDTATTYTNRSSCSTSRSNALSSLEGGSSRSVGITVVRPW